MTTRTENSRWLGDAGWALLICGLALFLISLNKLSVVTALPTIQRRLHAGMPALEWTTNAYNLAFTVLVPTGAMLGDRLGRRRMLAVGVAIFTAGSLAASLAGVMGQLIAARALQGFGAAAVLPLTLTVLTAAVPEDRRALAFGVWGGFNALAIPLGPVVGGFVIVHASWQWIFLLNVPVGLALLPLIRLRLHESHGPHGRLDVVGAVLASAALLGIVYAVSRGNDAGWTRVGILCPLMLGMVGLTAFIWWEYRYPSPMLPLRLFHSRTFSMLAAVGLLTATGAAGSIFLLTQYLQGVQNYSPFEAGLRTLPWTVTPIVVAPLGGLLAAHIGAKAVVTLGTAGLATGLAWFAYGINLHTRYSTIVAPMVLCGVGMSFFFAPLAHLVMAATATGDRGMASGASVALRELGGVLGVAVLGTVFLSNGALTTGQRFVSGLTPALWTGTACVVAATLLMLLIPSPTRHHVASPWSPRASSPPPEPGLVPPVMASDGCADSVSAA